MENQIFADGIGNIAVIGGVVRVDLVTYSATETDARGQAKPILTHRLVMGAEGFLRASEKILEAAQAIAQKTQSQTQPAPQPVPPQPAPPQPQVTQAPPAPPAPKAERPMPSPWTQPLVPKAPFP